MLSLADIVPLCSSHTFDIKEQDSGDENADTVDKYNTKIDIRCSECGMARSRQILLWV